MLVLTADSFGHSVKGQPWRSAGLTGLMCAGSEHKQKVVSGLLRDVLSKHKYCNIVSVRALFMYDVSGVAVLYCKHTFHQILKTDRQTPKLHIVCVSVTQPYFGLLH